MLQDFQGMEERCARDAAPAIDRQRLIQLGFRLAAPLQVE
jgi:hypothetical protein